MRVPILHNWRVLAILASSISVAIVLAESAKSQQGWPNEVYHARCIPQQSCSGDCVITWEPDPTNTCPSGTACVAFEGFFGQGLQFKACVASTVSTDKCNTGNVQPPPPPVATCWGLYYSCACRSLTSGECQNDTPAPFPCLCQGDSRGTTTYLANNNCT